jgi:hypothetical protein
MIQIDGKTLDLTNPSSWGNNVQIKYGGFIQQTQNGVTTRFGHEPKCASITMTLLVDPPKPAPCNCNFKGN